MMMQDPSTTTPQQADSSRPRRPSVLTTSSSFEDLVNAATGGEIFNTSFSTISTTKLEDPNANGRADPDGVMFEENYSDFYNLEGGQFESGYDQESHHAASNNDDGVNTTCPTDSQSLDSGVYTHNSAIRLQYDRRRVASKNRAVGLNDGASVATTIRSSSCWRNCTYCFFCLAVALVASAIGGTAFIIMKIYSNEESAYLHNVSGEQNSGAGNEDLPSQFPTETPTWGPTQMPTHFPSFGPTTFPSVQPTSTPTSYPSVAPSVAPSYPPSSLPSGFPTSPPSEVGPTSTPSAYPTGLPSATPSELPTIPPTRTPVDISDSRFFVHLREVVEDPDALVDLDTPQGRALAWLEREDQFELDILQLNAGTSEPRKRHMLRNLYQRFAMLTLDFALHDNVDRTHWSFSRLDVCLWTGVKCNANQEVNGINWARQNLTGTIPPELGLLTNLVSLDIAQNQLKGSLDPLYKLRAAKEIFVFENQISGPLTLGLENCRNLTRFMAGYNQLTGTLPSLNMRSLHWFRVNNNQITGSIPDTLVLDKVKIFDISSNQIGGSIPFNFSSTVVPNIRHLYLSNNLMNGTVPENFVSLGKGRVLQIYMNDNLLSGGFPTRFDEVKHLTNLDLSNNLFTSRLGKMCRMSVFEYGELVEMRADCRICNCDRICRTCFDNIDHLYEYDDDEWLFDDDTLFDDDQGDDDDDDTNFTVGGEITVNTDLDQGMGGFFALPNPMPAPQPQQQPTIPDRQVFVVQSEVAEFIIGPQKDTGNGGP